MKNNKKTKIISIISMVFIIIVGIIIYNVLSDENKITSAEKRWITDNSAKVQNINGEINNVIEEIRSNTIINNARQSIMYNNDIIEKKYGYYDTLRRKVESIIENIENEDIDTSILIKLKEDIITNNPRYWLANTSLSIIYWLLDNKEESNKQLKEALKKDQNKTSLFMLMLYLNLNQKNTAIHWLNYYLNHQDPMNLKEEFAIVCKPLIHLSLLIFFSCFKSNNLKTFLASSSVKIPLFSK